MIISTTIKYLNYQALSFLCQLFLFYKIFNTLEINEFSAYAIVQSFSSVSAIFLTLNSKVSMYKVFSHDRVAYYSVLAFFIIFITGSLIFFLSYSLLLFFFDLSYLSGGLLDNIGSSTLILYPILSAFYMLSGAFLNATRKTHLYGLHLTAYPVLLSLMLIYIGDFDLNSLLFFIILVNFSCGIVLFGCYSTTKRHKFSYYRIKKVLQYILKYSFQTLPVAFIKSAFDLVGKSVLNITSGAEALAILSFSLTIFSFFRSLQQALFKAVTPNFLIRKNIKPEEYFLVRRILTIKVIAVILFFSLSFIWLPYLSLLFPGKPQSVYSFDVLMILAIYTGLTYYKNFYLIFMKKSIILISNANKFAMISYFIGFIGLFSFDLNPKVYAILMCAIIIINLSLVRLHPKGVLDNKSGLKGVLK